MESQKHNKKIYEIIAVLLIFLLATVPAISATEEEIEESVVKGLEWLAAVQATDGSWGHSSCDRVAATGLVVLKFEDRAFDLGFSDPMDPEYEYHQEVIDGLDYILSHMQVQAISPEPTGDPDTNGNGIGVYFVDCGGHEIYNSSLAMAAIASSGNPELYGIILQDAVDYMAWTQADPACGAHRGGWRYGGGDVCDSDQSNTGYVTVALGYAASGFGSIIPQFVKDEHSIWIDLMQDDVDGDTHDGGSWYAPGWHWVNILKTGNLIYEMALVGDNPETQRVKDAIDYIERHWNDAGGCNTGWRDHRQAMFTMMKGFQAFGIETIEVGAIVIDWFDEVSTHLVNTQNVDGSWPNDCWGGPILSTAWALLTLEKAVPPPPGQVSIDIKPTSCPNPLNTKSNGVLPVAILGSEDVNVLEIDPASIRLEDVAPLRSNYEDVATPVSDPYDCNCTTDGPDGFLDLTLKFETQEIVEAIGDVNHGDVLELLLTGALFEEHSGTPIYGADCIIIRGKHKAPHQADINQDGIVNLDDLKILKDGWKESMKKK
ncbi:MAG: prenyltransferase/squalene oxidase repeat-containing protein [Planctomycetota bacterium]|jgi:hypothetical protein